MDFIQFSNQFLGICCLVLALSYPNENTNKERKFYDNVIVIFTGFLVSGKPFNIIVSVPLW